VHFLNSSQVLNHLPWQATLNSKRLKLELHTALDSVPCVACQFDIRPALGPLIFLYSQGLLSTGTGKGTYAGSHIVGSKSSGSQQNFPRIGSSQHCRGKFAFPSLHSKSSSHPCGRKGNQLPLERATCGLEECSSGKLAPTNGVVLCNAVDDASTCCPTERCTIGVTGSEYMFGAPTPTPCMAGFIQTGACVYWFSRSIMRIGGFVISIVCLMISAVQGWNS